MQRRTMQRGHWTLDHGSSRIRDVTRAAAGATLAIAVAAAGLVMRPSPAHADDNLVKRNPQDVCEFVAIRAKSDKNVSVEWRHAGAQSGMLRARNPKDVIGPWERFWICRDVATGAYYLQSQHPDSGLWYVVSAEVTYGGAESGMLRARSRQVDTWELFFLQEVGGGWFTLRSWQNGRLVAAEDGNAEPTTSMLRARTDPAAVGNWEQFTLVGLL